MRWMLALLLAGCSTTVSLGQRPTQPVVLLGPAVPHVSPSVASRSRTAPPRGTLLSVTCYTATGNRTASGVWPREGMAAGNRWPFGTRLLVEDVGMVTITDRIGWGSELDLYRDSRAECIRFGRRTLLVSPVQR